jgi:hypothetical protein
MCLCVASDRNVEGTLLCGLACESSLYGNDLGAAGATALLPALRELTALQSLTYVCTCRAGEGGVCGLPRAA